MLEKTGVTKLYFNQDCSKCWEAKCLLESEGEDFELVKYLNSKLTRQELQEVVNLLKISPYDLIRTKEKLFRDNFSNFSKDEYDWIEVMISHPELMERPILIKGNQAIIGRPPKRILEII